MRCRTAIVLASLWAVMGCGDSSEGPGSVDAEPTAIAGFWRVRIEPPPPRDADIIHWLLEETDGVVRGNTCTTTSEMVGGEWVLATVECDGSELVGTASGREFELDFVEHDAPMTGTLTEDGNSFTGERLFEGTVYPMSATRRDDEYPGM